MSLELYNKVRNVPLEAQRTIRGGRLNGFTDINPMWRIQILTEHFGVCGIGWKPEIVKQWLESYSNGEVAAFCDVNLYIKQDGAWSDAIPGTGGAKFVAKESGGMYVDDEAYKKAYTDALSVACKMLGIGADVYWSEGSKYTRGTVDDTLRGGTLRLEIEQALRSINKGTDYAERLASKNCGKPYDFLSNDELQNMLDFLRNKADASASE